MLYYLIGHFLDVPLDFGISELSTDETLGGEESIFRVYDGLTLG